MTRRSRSPIPARRPRAAWSTAAFALTQPLQANANGGTYAPVGGSAAPTGLLTYAGPTSNDAVTVGFKQPITATEGLRTGSYSKTLTFTLSTTTP